MKRKKRRKNREKNDSNKSRTLCQSCLHLTVIDEGGSLLPFNHREPVAIKFEFSETGLRASKIGDLPSPQASVEVKWQRTNEIGCTIESVNWKYHSKLSQGFNMWIIYIKNWC